MTSPSCSAMLAASARPTSPVEKSDGPSAASRSRVSPRSWLSRSSPPRRTAPPSISIAKARLTTPAWSLTTARRRRKVRRRKKRSKLSSRRRVSLPMVRPMSSSRPAPWALIAARTSGASAIRSTSCWASSLASSRRQTSSTSSLSIASSRAFLTASLSSAPCTASSTIGPCRTRAIARSTASLSTAATIASSAATSTARSTPVALPTVRTPRTPTPKSRAESGRWPF